MTVQLDESRLASLPSLSSGNHHPDSQMCVMEALAFVAAESWTDHPACCCPVIGAFCRSWNDALPSDADRDRLLKPLIPRLVGSRSTPAVEQRRAWLATDWLVRTCAPAWLTLVKDLEPHATALRGLPELISTERARDAQPTITAAEAAAGAAAEAAAGADAGDAAWAAAGAALQPTVTALQDSALGVLNEMLAVPEDEQLERTN